MTRDAGTPLRLRPLTLQDEPEARAAHSELQADDFPFLLGWDETMGWAQYVRQLADERRGCTFPDGRVPATFLVAEAGSRLIGRTSIRHTLNDFLLNFGGHIGYGVRPAFRRRGYATEILRQSLIIARSEGVGRVLVVCDDDNAGSIAIIERAGGVIEDVRADGDGSLVRRYWID